jgi:hypothetical protein
MRMRFIAVVMMVVTSMAARTSCAEDRAVGLDAADKRQASEAVAHYTRARSLLIAAINEFDRARKIARPDELLDPVRWRNTLIDRAEDLERVLDPQPRASTGGVQFAADPRLLSDRDK